MLVIQQYTIWASYVYTEAISKLPMRHFIQAQITQLATFYIKNFSIILKDDLLLIRFILAQFSMNLYCF